MFCVSVGCNVGKLFGFCSSCFGLVSYSGLVTNVSMFFSGLVNNSRQAGYSKLRWWLSSFVLVAGFAFFQSWFCYQTKIVLKVLLVTKSKLFCCLAWSSSVTVLHS